MKKLIFVLFLLFAVNAYATDGVTTYYVLRTPEEGTLDWTAKISNDLVTIDSVIHNISNDIANGRVSHDIELSSYSLDGDGFVRIDSDNDGTNEWTLNSCGILSSDANPFQISSSSLTTPVRVLYVGTTPSPLTTLLGVSAGSKDVPTGSVFVGNTCGSYAGSSSSYNVGVGYACLADLQSGNYNTAVGMGSLKSNMDSLNTAYGYDALYSLAKGSKNVAVGGNAGYSSTSGCLNIFLGYAAGYNEGGSSMLYIDNSTTYDPVIKADMSTDTVWLNRYVYISEDVTTKHLSADIISTDVIAAKYGNRVLSVDATRTVFTDIDARNMTGDSITVDVISMERIFFQSRQIASSPDLPATGRGVMYMSADGTLKFGSNAGGWHEVLNFYTK